MKPRQSLLARIASLFRRRRVVKPEPIPPQRPPREPKARSIEPLEGRIAPAVLIDAQTISFNDLDGDVVMVKLSKPLLTSGNVGNVFKFSDGTTDSAFASTGPQQLRLIDFNAFPKNLDTFISTAEGASITVTAAKGAGNVGNDLTNVGYVRATTISLGRVEIDGDLGQIDCGSGAPVALRALVVDSLYKFGDTTQPTSGSGATTAADRLESKISGELTYLDVKSDLFGYVHAVDGSPIFGSKITAPAKIGAVKIGGSLRGAAADNSGSISSARSIGPVQVLGLDDPLNPTDAAGLVGGGGKNSGSLVAATGIASINIADSLVGGAGLNSGAIVAGGNLPFVKVGDDVIGGAGIGSGTIQGALLTTGTITGDLVGGTGLNSGSISITKTIGTLTISGDVIGGGGSGSGGVVFGSVLPITTPPGLPTTISVGGDLVGGGGFASGSIHGLTALAVVKVTGDVTGGAADRSGTIISDGTITSVSVGKLIGGAGENSGSIFSGADPLLKGGLGTAIVADGMQGGSGISSGSIIASRIGLVRVGSATHSASITGGDGDFSGAVISTSMIRLVQVFGSVVGDDGDHSGAIASNGALSSVTITANIAGGGGDFSGSIRAQEIINDDFTGTAAGLGIISIGGGISGGSGAQSGRIEASGNLTSLVASSLGGGAGLDSGTIVAGAGFLGAGNAGTIKVGGVVDSTISVRGKLTAFTAGSLTDAVVRVGRDLVTAIVNGSVTNSTISAVGQAVPDLLLGDVAIAALTVKGNVSGSHILAGYDLTGAPVNADASIGTVTVTGSWTASDLVAGVQDVNGDGFGNADDSKITLGTNRAGFVSKIASIIINGTVAGTAGGTDHFGFTAQRIGAFKSGGVATILTPGLDDKPLGTTGDVRLHEVSV